MSSARILALGLLFVSFVIPLPLDGQWMKIKVSSKGYTVDVFNDDELEKASFKTVVYIRLEQSASSYDFDCWGETSPGLWSQILDGGWQGVVGADEHLALGGTLTVQDDEGDWISGAHFDRITLKFGKGVLKSARLTSFAGAVMDGAVDGKPYVGDLRLSGKLVDEDDLPF